MDMVIVLILLLLAVPAYAVDVFVNNSSGCPGSGTTGSPYCSIQNALNNAAAGQVIKIRTGTGVYSELASVSGKNGSAGNPIILTKDTGATFVIRNAAGPTFNGSVEVRESSYWEFRNLTCDANGVNPSWACILVGCDNQNCPGIVVDGNTFQNWSTTSTQWAAEPLVLNGCSMQQGGCGGGTNKYITAIVTNNTFTNIEGQAMQIQANDGTLISGNTITNIKCSYNNNGFEHRAVGIFLPYDNQNLTIENNSIHDFPGWASCTKTPLSASPNIAAIWCDVGLGTPDQNIIIRKNTMYNLDQSGSTSDDSQTAWGVFVEAGCAGFQVYNNIMYNIRTAGIASSYHSLNGSQALNKYYSNTMYKTGWGFYLKEGRIDIKNNIVSNPNASMFCFGCGSGSPSNITLTSNNNMYDQRSGTTIADVAGVGTKTLATWRTYCSCDGSAVSGSPSFVSEVTPNFHIQSGSAAKDIGATLGSPWNTDFDGVTRVAVYDSGAFEYVATGRRKIAQY